MSRLPTFEQMLDTARGYLSAARDELASDWRDGAGPTPKQARHFHEARRLIGEAKAEIDRAKGAR